MLYPTTGPFGQGGGFQNKDALVASCVVPSRFIIDVGSNKKSTINIAGIQKSFENYFWVLQQHYY